MEQCVRLEQCKYFGEALHEMPEIIAEGYKNRFCHTDSSSCARLVIATHAGPEAVPIDLGPHESTKAIKLLQVMGLKQAHQLFL